MVSGGQPFQPEILGKTDPFGAKTRNRRFLVDIRSQRLSRNT